MLPNVKPTLYFKDYPAEKLIITSIRSRLTPEENRVREAILADIIKQGKPCSVNELVVDGIDDLKQVVNTLFSKRVIVSDDLSQDIPFAYPVSALPTPHRVTLADGRSFYAMCALDALGTTFTFQQDVRITSQCAECGHAVLIGIIDKRIRHMHPQSLHVLHADLSISDN